MTQIDTSKWGKFKVGDLFEIKLSKNDLKIEECNTGSTPLISAGNENNGIVGYINKEDFEVFPANSITVDMFGKVFVQTKDFCAVSHGRVNILIPKYTLSLPTLFFIVSVLQREIKDKFDFANMCTSKKISKQNILLPIIFSGSPDWQFMEDYMKEITKLAAKRVEKLKEEKTKYKIDTKGWGKFRVGDLFTVYLGDYNNPKFLTEDENGIPLVSATAINNGISGYYKKTPDLKVITKNKITWGKQCPYFYYQTTDFITGQGTYYLDVSALSFYTSLFICAVLNNEISQKYDYNNCLIGKKLSEEIILLPITTKGSPDWQFMEDYMKNIMEQAKKKFSDIPQ